MNDRVLGSLLMIAGGLVSVFLRDRIAQLWVDGQNLVFRFHMGDNATRSTQDTLLFVGTVVTVVGVLYLFGVIR